MIETAFTRTFGIRAPVVAAPIAASPEPILWKTLLDDFALHGLSADGLERVVRLREALAPSIEHRRRSTKV